MAAEIIPIQLSLTHGDGVTLWAPRWVEDGEDWEAFLGHGDALYLLPDAAHLAAFIRTVDEHDLVDHPAWESARRSLADQLVPDDDYQFDLVGIPELVSAPPDLFSLAELTDTVAILRSLAEVCGLDAIDEVLSATAGFAVAAQGPSAFIGRSGKKLWREIGSVVADRWDEVIDALDNVVETPDVAEDAVAAAQRELDAVSAVAHAPSDEALGTTASASVASEEPAGDAADDDRADDDDDDRDPDLAFWDEVGIDCVSLTYGGRTGWSLRCYLGDTAVFMSTNSTIQLYPSPAALEEYLADPTASNALSHLDAWTTIREAVDGGEASVIAGPENTYRLDGLAEQLAQGPESVDADQLALAVELLLDAAAARGDDEVPAAMSSASPLGNLVRAVTQPDPDRLPPSPPFDDEAAAFRALVESFASTLTWH